MDHFDKVRSSRAGFIRSIKYKVINNKNLVLLRLFVLKCLKVLFKFGNSTFVWRSTWPKSLPNASKSHQDTFHFFINSELLRGLIDFLLIKNFWIKKTLGLQQEISNRRKCQKIMVENKWLFGVTKSIRNTSKRSIAKTFG